MSFGDYSKTTYVNTTTPAINQTNLNNAEDKIEDIDEELRRSKTFALSEYLTAFYQRNSKEIEIFDNSSDWTANPEGTISNDTTNFIMSNQSVKLLEPNNTAGWLGMYRSISSLDLETFVNGEASSTSDVIMIVFYISDIAAFQSIQFKLGDDNTNNYSIYYTSASLDTGWNILIPQKSDFTTNNSPTGWDDITYVRCEAYTNANYQNDYISWQFAQLIREDADYSGYGNSFQQYTSSGWDNVFSINSDYYTIYFDRASNKLGITKLNPNNDETQLYLGYASVSSFIAKVQIICKDSGDTPSLTWYVDSDNYIEVYVSSNNLTIYRYEAGSGTTVSQALSTNLVKSEEIEFYFEKNDLELRLIAKHSGDVDILESVTTITDSGSIYFGCSGTASYGLITDFVLSHSQSHNLIDTNPKTIVKLTSENVSASTTLQNDDELFVTLDPNSLFEISANLIVYSASSSLGDFKCAWTGSGDLEIVGYRHSKGPSINTTNILDTVINTACRDLGTENIFGVDNTRYSSVQETFLMRSGDKGGVLQLRWAQNTSNAFATQVTAGSYLKITQLR